MHEPFLMLIGRPTKIAAERFQVLREAGLDLRLGARLFDSANYHQSLSERHEDTAEKLQRLLEVGNRISAPAFDIVLDRIVSRKATRIDWRFEPSAGKTPGFSAVQDAIRAAFDRTDGIADPVSHAPHVTFGYGAPEPMAKLQFPGIAWMVDRIELVRRMHGPYGYDTIAGWDLLEPPHRASTQAMLF